MVYELYWQKGGKLTFYVWAGLELEQTAGQHDELLIVKHLA